MSRRASPTGWSRILVATDFSSSARVALRSAEALARETGAALVLVHVVDLPSASYAFGAEALGLPDVRETWGDEARKALRRIAQRARARGARIVEAVVRIGRPWSEILEAAREHGADLVCLGNSGRSGFQRVLLGSTAENVIRHSPLPVLVTRSRPMRGLRRVLVPVSFDEGSRAALTFALERLPRRTELEAFHAVSPIELAAPWSVVEPPPVAELTGELRDFLDAAGGRRLRAHVEYRDHPAAAILRRARAWKADLILLCTHGRRGLAHVLLGSVAEKVARHADRPVLVLPPLGRAAARVETRDRPARARAVRAAAREPVGEVVSRPLGRRRPGPWTGQAHTGRGGPAGRRGGTRPKMRRG